MNQIVKAFILKHQLIQEGDHLFVAVSGGPDSVALIHYLWKHYKSRCELSVGHVEHGLRSEESKADLEFVRTLSEKLNLPFYCLEADVVKVKEEQRLSTQAAARKVRYEWFAEKMNEIQAQKLVFAHHGDDQIETMLMRQVRGSYDGLKGMPVKREFAKRELIRPFLCINKEDIYQYCQRNNLTYRIDSSNEEEEYQRNRYRKNVLPFLQSENPNVHVVFQRQSEWLNDDHRYLNELAKQKLTTIVQKKDVDEIVLSIERFQTVPITLQRRGLHLILNYLSVNIERDISSDHIESLIKFMNSKTPSGSLDLPKGLCVVKSYDDCIFSTKDQNNNEKILPEKLIAVPGMIKLDEGKITAEILDKKNGLSKDRSVFFADYHKLTFPLSVRSRQTGDRMTPVGMKGSKKLKDIFMDFKVPRFKRDDWPVVVDANGEIVWLPMLKRSNLALVSEETKKVFVLRYEVDDIP
ncbi:tRNA lysidine(34) synthetase TilS [Bacillus shivajii]|uniref:tRNA lysidine(34) synthetase TilS n=1 Tax=Bacillus shivajii TaxID=1983719 RepID=UPI001CFB14CE|nr:tRNA lysidine(34) synthetase TilS [Bacillus shivajii]UCZ53325.1 tRNA lysidine(34) synthetase TilS [Bacillus shivajii]